MVQVTARLPDGLAIEYYLDDIEDLRCGMAALKDPADPALDWAEVRVRCSLRMLVAEQQLFSRQSARRAPEG